MSEEIYKQQHEDTATNYKKYAILKKLKHETVNLNQKNELRKQSFTYSTLIIFTVV
jgi:hypothetical protein